MLVHPTSLAGPLPAGDFGEASRAFVDWLAEARLTWWQLLPTGPAGPGFSPYSATSVFAGDPSFIDLGRLVEDGLLDASDIVASPPERNADLARNRRERSRLLKKAFTRGESAKYEKDQFDAFLERSRGWLLNFALFSAIKERNEDKPYFQWPEELRVRRRAALADAGRELAESVRFHMFAQFLFDRDLAALADYAAKRNVALMGDAPIFVAHDSADVWANPEIFQMDADFGLSCVAGVPPDAFSDDGQLWGNPLYDWQVLARGQYSFWIERLRHAFLHVSSLRLDHFIGFQRYFAIPKGATTAKLGSYRQGPGHAFFDAVRRNLGPVELVAEDLGVLTDEVRALRDDFDLPGMNILQFSFSTDHDAEKTRPHRYRPRSVVYTGTHDNETLRGWLTSPPENSSADAKKRWARERACALAYFGLEGETDETKILRAMIRGVFANQADTAIVPIQDVLALGAESRMNRPGVADGNWSFRLLPGELRSADAEWLGQLAETFGRSAPGGA